MKDLRKKKRLTQTEMAEMLGISASAYSQYELGTKTPRDDIKVEIARILGRSVKFIFFNQDAH